MTFKGLAKPSRPAARTMSAMAIVSPIDNSGIGFLFLLTRLSFGQVPECEVSSSIWINSYGARTENAKGSSTSPTRDASSPVVVVGSWRTHTVPNSSTFLNVAVHFSPALTGSGA